MQHAEYIANKYNQTATAAFRPWGKTAASNGKPKMYNAIKLKLVRYKLKVRGWIYSALQGTHHHFTCHLPLDIGIVANFFLKLFYSGITVDEEQTAKIKNLPDDSIVVYANKYKSYFEYLFYHTRYKKNGAAAPEIGFDYEVFVFQPFSRIARTALAHIDWFLTHFSLPDPYKSGYIRGELEKGKKGFLSLVEKKGFYRRFVKSDTDPIRYLIEMQNQTERPIFIVPQLIFYSKNPPNSIPSVADMLFGTEERPGTLRRLAILSKNPGRVFVEVSEPLNLRKFLDLGENGDLPVEKQARVLRQQLIVQLNRHRQSITGPVLKTREELKENILTNDRLRSFINKYAESRKIPLYKVYKEADSDLEEITARYNIRVVKAFSIGLTWIFKAMFEEVNINTDMLNKIKHMSRRGPLVLAPCHKSHIDYLILSYIMHHNNMPCPHIAAGKNLSFWPVGPLLRGGGAFFIRRTFRGAKLYSKVFAEYIYKLLEEGFNVEFFIEGGRSRTGKLIKPKLGLLSILLNAFRENACEDLIFVPVYIGYDRVLEESSYLHELEGGKKKPENFRQVIKARKFLKTRYGKIYIRFHEPVSLNELLAQNGSRINEMSSKQFNMMIRNLGYRITNAIDAETVITPHAVVAAAILNTPKPRFSYDHLMADIDTYMNYLFAIDAKLADTILADYAHAVDYVIDNYQGRKFLERISKDKGKPTPDTMYMINPSRRPSLEYYKNNGIIAFVPAAFTALSILRKDAFQFSISDLLDSYRFLREFFINEFVYEMDETSESCLRKCLKTFVDDAMLMPHPTLPDTFNLTSAGFRKLKLFSGFCKTFFESYWVVLSVFKRYPKDFMDSKGLLKKVQSMGNRMLKRREIERPEALSRISYKNAIEFFQTRGIKGMDNAEKIDHFSDEIQQYLEHLRE